jgi:hypothetical protein
MTSPAILLSRKFLALAILGCAGAVVGAEFPVPAYHPTAILVQSDGKWLPVFSATWNGQAVIKDGEKPRKLSTEPHLRFARATDFSPGFVDLKTPTDRRPLEGEGSYLLQVATADRLYTNCMAVMITIEPTQSLVVKATTHIAIKGIDDLKSGKPADITMRFPSSSLAGMQAVLLVFSNGREIRTSHSDSAGMFFRRLEVQNHENILRAYHEKYGTSPHPVEPYLRFQPVFPGDVALASLPEAVHLTMTVNRDGYIEDPKLQETLPNPAALAILRAVGGWLYLPKLEDGYSIAAEKTLTIQLHGPAAASAKPAQP